MRTHAGRVDWEQPGVDGRTQRNRAAHLDFDSLDRDIGCFCESRCPREAAAVEDIHFQPVERFAVRLALSRRF